MKKTTLFKGVLVIASLLLMQFSSSAQVMPQPSSSCMVMRTVGFTEVTVEYSSPGVKGRTIYGDLVPYDQAWRAGANAATKVTFGTSVKIGDKNVRAGSYALFITPSKSGDWTVHISSANSVFDFYNRETQKVNMEELAKKDVATASVKPMDLKDNQERLKYDIDQAENGNIMISMSWGDKKVSFMAEIDPMAIMKSMEENVKKSIE